MKVTELKIGLTPNAHEDPDCPGGETTFHFGMSRKGVDGSQEFGRVIVGKREGGSFDRAQKTAALIAQEFGWILNRLVSDDNANASGNGVTKLPMPQTFRMLPFAPRTERTS
jgi:hypothetical protein